MAKSLASQISSNGSPSLEQSRLSFRKSIFQMFGSSNAASEKKMEYSSQGEWVIVRIALGEIPNEPPSITGMTEKTPNSFDGVMSIRLLESSDGRRVRHIRRNVCPIYRCMRCWTVCEKWHHAQLTQLSPTALRHAGAGAGAEARFIFLRAMLDIILNSATSMKHLG
ncbi:hypothetical protein Tco_1104381 [Tanacetum coccineum]